jgi:hypothetical protein
VSAPGPARGVSGGRGGEGLRAREARNGLAGDVVPREPAAEVSYFGW